MVQSHANGQPALAFYAWDDERARVPAVCAQRADARGEQISNVTAFVTRSTEPTEREAYHRWVDQPADEQRLIGVFERFGLPDRLS